MINSEAIIQVADIERDIFSDAWSKEQLIESLGYEYNQLITIYEENSVAGYLLYSIIVDESELLRIAVRKDLQKKGYGNQLMKEYIDVLNDKDINKSILEVRKNNGKAQALYKKYGYEEIFTRKNYYKEPVDDAVLMQLIVS